MGKKVVYSLIVVLIFIIAHTEMNNHGCRCNYPLRTRLITAAMHKAQCGMGSKVVHLLIVLLFWFSLLQTLIKSHGCHCSPPLHTRSSMTAAASAKINDDRDYCRQRPSLRKLDLFSNIRIFEKWNFRKLSYTFTTQNARRRKMGKAVFCWLLCADTLLLMFGNADDHDFHSDFSSSRPI